MGIPFLLPALFTLGSMAVNTIGNNRAADAIATANRLESDRQDRLDNQAFQINAEATERFDDFGSQKEETSAQLADFFKEAAQAAPPTEAAAPKTTSNLVVNADARASEAASQKNDSRAEALGDVRALGSLLGDFGRQGQRDASELNLIGAFKRGSASVLPAELAAAQQKGAGLRTLGDLLSIGAGFTMPGALTAAGTASGSIPWLSSAGTARAGTVAQTSNFGGAMLPSLY